MLVFWWRCWSVLEGKIPKMNSKTKPLPPALIPFKGVSHPWKNIVTWFFSTICSNLKRFCVFSCFGWRTPHTLTKKDNAKIFSVNLFLSSKFHLLTPHFLFFQLADLQLLLMLLDQGSKKLTKLRYLDGWKDHWPTREGCCLLFLLFLGWEGKENLFKKGKFLKHSTSVQVVFWWVVLEVWTYRWTKFVSRSIRCRYLHHSETFVSWSWDLWWFFCSFTDWKHVGLRDAVRLKFDTWATKPTSDMSG